jgi:competence protein ComEC
MEWKLSGRTTIRLCALALLAGILFIQMLPDLPPLIWALLLLPFGGLAWRWPQWFLPIVFLVAGACWAIYRADLILSESLAPSLEGVDLVVEGHVADLPSPTERGQRFVFLIDRAWQAGQSVTVPQQVLLSRYGAHPMPVVGDVWRLTVRLKRPHGFRNPGGFDYEAYLFQQRLRATGYVRESPPPRRLSGLTDSQAPLPAVRLNRIRQQLSDRIRVLLPDQRFTAMISAFANGDDDSIPDDQWDVLNRTGTSHLVAISGMNIGWVAGLVYLIAFRLWAVLGRVSLRWPAPMVAAWCALLAGAGYAALAGFAIPTQRALVMLVAGMAAVLLGRRVAPSVMLALALLAVLVFDPLSVLAPGFWLSFAAVAVILYAVSRQSDRPWREMIVAWGKLQWAIALGMLPLLLLLFQQVSVSGPVANLIAIPVIEIIVIPATLLGVVASTILPDSVAAWPFLLADQTLTWLWPWLETLARLPITLWSQHAPPLWAVFAALVGAALLLAPRGWPARWLGILWLLPMVLLRPAAPMAGAAWLTLLDVGQGLAVVVRTATHTLVYDTGARYSARFDAGSAVILPYLRHEGLRRVSTLIISHGDNDHIGGSSALLARLPVDRILSSVPERLPAAESCQNGQSWMWDDVRFEILHPTNGGKLRGNDRSCVLRIETRSGQALLPGDISARAERFLGREQPQRLAATVLVAPHHGSRSSSTEIFIDRVNPKLVLMPVGYRNRYRHPHPDVLARYHERGTEVMDSPSAGAIQVRFDPAGWRVDRDRDLRRRYWHRR